MVKKLDSAVSQGQVFDASILMHFASLEDPRDNRGKEHLLLDIITISNCLFTVANLITWTSESLTLLDSS